MNMKVLCPESNAFAKIPVLAFFCLFLMTVAVQASGTISGTVYNDYNMNGVRNTTGTSPDYAVDGGLGGVTVTVYAPNGASKTATTASNGTYSINTAAAPALPVGPYRVEFTNFPSGYFPSALGTNNASTVRFLADGSASNVDLGVIEPSDYCQTNPWLVTNSYVVGNGAFSTLVVFPYNYSDDLDGNIGGAWTTLPSRNATLAPTAIGDATLVGATFGLAWNNQTNKIFASAYLKRGARFGSTALGESTGAIYMIDNPLSGNPTQSLFVDLNAVFGAGTAGANTHPVATTADWTDDSATISEVGKRALGGLKLSKDGATLYTVNLADKRLYVIPTSGPLNSLTITRFNIPTTGLATSSGDCQSSDVRPFALGRDRSGQIYVGAVCSAESEAGSNKLHAFVWRFDNPGFTMVANNNLTFTRTAGAAENVTWQNWANSTPGLSRAAPMLTDLEFDGGTMILGFRDRYGDQIVTPDFYRGYGDVMRACPSGATFAFESNGTCGGVTTAGTETNAGNGGREFYLDLNGDNRQEGGLGGLTQVPGFNHVVTTFYDPVTYNSSGTRVNNYYTAGVQRYHNTTGVMTGAYDVYLDADPGNFGKADGVGDSDVLCAPAPLQIGNRVWNDNDADGVQDSNENGIASVAVQLWADTDQNNSVDTLVGTTTTDSSGNYVFGGAGNANLSTYACGTGSADVRVDSSNDDAEQNLSDNSVSVTNSDLELTADGATLQLVGVRFNGVNIPIGATITNAYLEFTPRSDGQTVNTGNPSITIRAEDVDNSVTYLTPASNLSSRATTSASVNWTPGNWTVGTPAQTSNIASLVQAVVNRTGWVGGHSMSFIMSGAAANNFRRAWSFDGSAAGAPRLVVQYSQTCSYSVNPTTRYEVRLPASNFTAGQPLFGRSPSPADTDASANGDSRDSDGVPSGGQVVISLLTGAKGNNNHTFDFGFYVPTTAANASIIGRVRTPEGYGLGKVNVMVSGGNLPQPRYAMTSAFGYYAFDDLPVGEIYIVTVTSKNYSFANPSRVFNLGDNITDADFEALPAVQTGTKTIESKLISPK